MRSVRSAADRLALELAEHEHARDESAFLALDVSLRLAKCQNERARLAPLSKARRLAEQRWQRTNERLRTARSSGP